MRYILIFLAFLLVAQVQAAEYQKDDFAFGYNLEVDGSGAIYSVFLPQDVYGNSVQAGLRDIRIFNKQGEAVPHEIRIPAMKGENLHTAVQIPLFPLSSQDTRNRDNLSVVIRRNSSGNIINIQSNNTGASSVMSYLFDMDKAGPYPLKLQLELEANEGFMVQVTLQSSSDLEKWRREMTGTLADLEFMGNRLLHHELTLNRKGGRYLRLVMADTKSEVRITRAKAVSGPLSLRMKREWVTLPLTKRVENGVTFLEAEAGTAFPVDSLQLKFPQSNSILHVRMQSRTNSDALWRNNSSKLFYTLLEKGTELQNEPLRIGRSVNRFYRFEVLQDGAGLEEMMPQLQFGYIPHELIFVARGEGPFVLAFGNGNMDKDDLQRRGNILQGIKDGKGKSLIHPATLGGRLVLGGKSHLQVMPERPWKKIILWLVLVAGVITLGFMVWSLSRKMGRAGD
jgi:hypothetical protein